MSSEIKSFEHKPVGYGEHLLKDHFVEARFTNSDRTWIEVITNEKGSSLTSTHIEFDENSWQYKALMTVTDVDKIHEATYHHNEKQRKEFCLSSVCGSFGCSFYCYDVCCCPRSQLDPDGLIRSLS